jgi:hypothetical protein
MLTMDKTMSRLQGPWMPQVSWQHLFACSQYSGLAGLSMCGLSWVGVISLGLTRGGAIAAGVAVAAA